MAPTGLSVNSGPIGMATPSFKTQLLRAMVRGVVTLPKSGLRQVHNCAHFESRQTAWAYVIILAQLTPVVP